MAVLLRTVDICRDFKQGSQTVHALVDVNVSIQPGTLTMLAGRSGSGKATLMKMASSVFVWRGCIPRNGTGWLRKL